MRYVEFKGKKQGYQKKQCASKQLSTNLIRRTEIEVLSPPALRLK